MGRDRAKVYFAELDESLSPVSAITLFFCEIPLEDSIHREAQKGHILLVAGAVCVALACSSSLFQLI